jgi:type 2 lantibiotic biosynthesis protein LanM
VKFRDSIRAQYYLAVLEREISKTISEFPKAPFLSEDFSSFVHGFSIELAEELDQILLPTVVYELHESKQQGLLKGKTSFERYNSFFLDDLGYTSQARAVVEKYPFLFEMIDLVTVRSFINLTTCLKRFETDFTKIRQHFELSSNSRIEKIKILSSSDRHRSQQSLLLYLSGEKKLIYKPVDLHPDQLFCKFVQELQLQTSFDLWCRKILPKEGYGWLEYIPTNICNSIEEIKHFFQRAGVLLAVANTLNYSDGHCENILAHGAFPVLLDSETLFQNYAMPIEEDKSIISTQLIQKFTKKYQNKINYSALQSIEEERFESLFTHAVNDQTDDIHVSYSGYSSETNHHRPIFRGKFYNSIDFIDEVVAGFCFGYDAISKKASQLLKYSSWWDQVACVHSRMVLRDTSAYFYLQRCIQQPEYCRSKKKAIALIRNKLGDTPFTDYEMQDTLELNIPYFYQKPGERDLYNGKDPCYRNVFPSTAIDWLRKHLSNRSDDRKQYDCELICKYLSKKNMAPALI